MISSQTIPAWTSDPSKLSKKAVGYFRARLRNRVHQLILGKYLKLEASGLARAEIARRIYKRPEQITRLLGAPGNWTLDTVSDLLLAMGCELSISAIHLSAYNEASAPLETVIPEQTETHPNVPLSINIISSATNAAEGKSMISNVLGSVPFDVGQHEQKRPAASLSYIYAKEAA